MHGETTSTSIQTEATSQTPGHIPHHHNNVLFHHEPHPHQPRNVNLLHEAEKAAAGFNSKLALLLTKGVGTMVCAYIFAALAIIGFPGLLGAQISQWVQWTSQTFIQLTMLSVIMVGQAVLGHKQELQSDEQYNTTISSYHDIEQIMHHLAAQDAELLRHARMLMQLLEKNGISLAQLEADGVTAGHLSESATQLQSSVNDPTKGAKTPDSVEGNA